MKQFTVILTCLFLVLSGVTMPAAQDSTPACEGCGCAAMSCCPSDSVPNDPVSSPPERVLTQKLVAVEFVIFESVRSHSELPVSRSTSKNSLTAPSIPLFIRNCQFLM